jgi:hypothetical protein
MAEITFHSLRRPWPLLAFADREKRRRVMATVMPTMESSPPAAKLAARRERGWKGLVEGPKEAELSPSLEPSCWWPRVWLDFFGRLAAK